MATEIRQGIAWVVLTRPPHNAINPALVHSLQRVLLASLGDDQVKGIVLTGSGKGFAAGADLAFFVRQVSTGQLDRIEQFSGHLHQLCNTIAASEKPVIAAIRGTALGAGLELALSCGRIIASRTATLGLPETGLGICPGSGGTQRTPRRIGVGLAKWLIYTGHLLSANDALKLGLVDGCVADEDLESAAMAQMENWAAERDSSGASIALPDAYRSLEQVFAGHSVQTLLELARQGAFPDHWETRTRRAVLKLATRSAHALLMAQRLIDQGQTLALADALKLEIAAQREMFLHDDARQGLQSAI